MMTILAKYGKVELVYQLITKIRIAWRILEDMKNSNLIPDAATKDLLVKSLWKEGEASIVEESCDKINSVCSHKQHGHKWTVNSEDLARVYNLYSNCFKLSTS
uniref:Pentatricopeptide repeat-containing protein n=1 Tax=Populus trichocarpa TaxID=3694 RepID=A0A2K1ZNJ0_POPTR